MDLNVWSYCMKYWTCSSHWGNIISHFYNARKKVSLFINSSSPAYPICSCDADPAALAKYVVALLRKDKPKSALKELCIDQLEVFLAKGTCKLCTYAIKLCNSYRVQKSFVYMFTKKRTFLAVAHIFSVCTLFPSPTQPPGGAWYMVHIQPHLRNRDRRFVGIVHRHASRPSPPQISLTASYQLVAFCHPSIIIQVLQWHWVLHKVESLLTVYREEYTWTTQISSLLSFFKKKEERSRSTRALLFLQLHCCHHDEN